MLSGTATGTLEVTEKTILGLYRRRCSYITLEGERCKYSPRPGSTLCGRHGGLTPANREKARALLMEAAEPAIWRLLQIINNDDLSAAVHLRACSIVLSRTMTTINDPVGDGPSDEPDFAQMDTEELESKTLEMLAQIREQRMEEAENKAPSKSGKVH